MVKYQPPVPLLITLYHSFRRGLAYQKGKKGRKPASTHSPACLGHAELSSREAFEPMPKLLSTERLPKTLILLLVMSILSLGLLKSASYIYWNAPLRSVLAAIKYEEYRQYQGIAADTVAYKTVEKNYKTGQVYVLVRYKDDPGFDYRYIYYLFVPSANPQRTHDYHKMRLQVFYRNRPVDKDNLQAERACTHPPLESIYAADAYF